MKKKNNSKKDPFETDCGSEYVSTCSPPDSDEILYSNDAKGMDGKAQDLTSESEKAYREIARDIVDVSEGQLKEQNDSKSSLKLTFTVFFIVFIIVQYAVMIAFLYAKAFIPGIGLSDTIVITYITSVFVETLGAIIFMIKYAFDSSQEVNILKILNSVIRYYQKFKD